MELKDAIRARHSVRKYTEIPIETPKGKEAEEKTGYHGESLVLLAPTAVNQQIFRFILHDGNVVEAKALFSMTGYTSIDLGIVKRHFEIGAGTENFKWK